MGIAIVATLLNPSEGNWGLIALGIALGAVVGVPAARQVKMTAMPQMVALFNGVGGGAVFLIAWAEFRRSGGYAHTATYIAVFSLFAAIVGSVSFWGSNIAFGKLQEIIPGRPITLGAGQQAVNGLLLVLALAAGVDIAAGSHSEGIFIGMLICAALLGNAVVLPIGGADMPVVISKVPNTLHTPLMSGTNAIHGIVLLGGLLVIGLAGNGTFNKVILVIAIAFGTINIVGGFLVTDRMLEMFKSKPKSKPEADEEVKGG